MYCIEILGYGTIHLLYSVGFWAELLLELI